MDYQGVVNFLVYDTRHFFLSSSQKDPKRIPEYRRKYSGIYSESFKHDSKYVTKNVMSPTQKQI